MTCWVSLLESKAPALPTASVRAMTEGSVRATRKTKSSIRTSGRPWGNAHESLTVFSVSLCVAIAVEHVQLLGHPDEVIAGARDVASCWVGLQLPAEMGRRSVELSCFSGQNTFCVF